MQAAAADDAAAAAGMLFSGAGLVRRGQQCLALLIADASDRVQPESSMPQQQLVQWRWAGWVVRAQQRPALFLLVVFVSKGCTALSKRVAAYVCWRVWLSVCACFCLVRMSLCAGHSEGVP